ncbi:hypothetical protein L484_003241 [Morus notabilis]|uniref:Uncharacterized protein n=1 Tax=Morus notabilis TaxID=981085 RepID=W9RYS1_9ROSA|nr:uncharacterized protein LOC21386783 [Morus notabilis]EXB78380.1 hypothetical protein L484_003241 [Morus notabilis]
MYVAQEAVALKFRVSTAGNRNFWPQRRSICPRIQNSPLKTTRCFVDDHENERYGLSVHPRLIAVAPSVAWVLSKEYGSSGVLSIERPKSDMSQKSPSKSATANPALDDGGGNTKDGGDGVDIGGGSGSGSSGGANDDDKYRFDDDDDDEEGFSLFGKRVLAPEIFDRITMNAVLSEWKQTMKDLPKGLQRACEMGLLTTAEITKFFWFHTRPTLARLFVRLLPKGLSMDFYAKMMSDPALPWKVIFEAVSSVGWSVRLDFENKYNHGKESEWNSNDFMIKREWHSVVVKAVTNAAFNTFIVFSLAPSSEFIRLRNLPNNVFEKSRRFQQFDMQKRALSFFRKAVSLFTLGFATKAAAEIRLLISTDHKKTRSIGTFATLSKEALAAGLSLGLLVNLRHQLMWGIDRKLDRHFDVTKVSLAFCLALRFLNVGIGTQSQKYWIGSEDQDLNHLLVPNFEDYSWLGLKNIVVTGSRLGDTSNKTQTAAKRKRVVKKKVIANQC